MSNESDGTLDVVDRKSGKVTEKILLSGHPNNIAVTKDSGRVLVGIAEEPGALDVIGTASLKVVKSIPVNGRLHNAGARSVSVIDTQAMKSVATVPVGEVPKRINTLVMR